MWHCLGSNFGERKKYWLYFVIQVHSYWSEFRRAFSCSHPDVPRKLRNTQLLCRFISGSLAQNPCSSRSKINLWGLRPKIQFVFIWKWEDMEPHNERPGRTALSQSLLTIISFCSVSISFSPHFSSLLLYYTSSGSLDLSPHQSHLHIVIYP